MNSKKLLCFALFFTSTLLSYQAWGQVLERQSLLPPDIDAVVNPRPSIDPSVPTLEPKVIVGVIDDGVDYTHPILAPHAVFKRDANGVPIGFGRDFVGRDDWAHPRYGRTTHPSQWLVMQTILPAEIAEISKVLFFFSTFFAQSSNSVSKQFPKYASLLQTERLLEFESAQFATHGTMVAGLASYDAPEIGIIGYRVFPMVIDLTSLLPEGQDTSSNSDPDSLNPTLSSQIGPSVSALSSGELSSLRKIESWIHGINSLDYQKSTLQKGVPTSSTLASKANAADEPVDDFGQGFLDAIDSANRDGVRVVNMSFGGSGDEPWSKAIKTKIASLPHIAFIAAAGNEATWSSDASGRARGLGPCGGKTPGNLLCVGALKEGAKFADFTSFNIESTNKLVFARGTNIISTSAQGWCDESELAPLLAFSLDPTKGARFDQKFTLSDRSSIESGLSKCLNRNSMMTADGTSFSSPLVARIVALKLAKNPNLSGAAAIDRVLEESETIKQGIVTSSMLRIRKPSWMSPKADENYERRKDGTTRRSKSRKSPQSNASYFEFDIPKN